MADDVFSQSMDWFQSYWRTMPSGEVPLSELDRKIAELRAVEAWLSMNQGLLRSSIHMLEVQRDMLSRFKNTTQNMSGQESAQTMNQAFLEAMQRFSAFWMPRPPTGGDHT